MTTHDDPGRVFRKLAQNNALANLRLDLALSALLPGEFEAPRKSFFPSIKATLNHLLTVDWFYVDALEGGTLGPGAWAIELPCATPAALCEAQRAVDRRLLLLTDALTIEKLGSPVAIHRRDRIQHERMDDVFSHLFQHQTHHRGQVHAMMSDTSVQPPQLDEFIVADDAAVRRHEMAVLGWSETDLMS